jgi:hypothetical protein
MSQHFLTDTAKLSQCARCKGWIYEGHLYGFLRRVEPTRLNFADEMKMRMSGRKVFGTVRVGSDFELNYRTAWHIAKDEADSLALVAHDCQFPTYFEPEPLYPPTTPKEPNF